PADPRPSLHPTVVGHHSLHQGTTRTPSTSGSRGQRTPASGAPAFAYVLAVNVGCRTGTTLDCVGRVSTTEAAPREPTRVGLLAGAGAVDRDPAAWGRFESVDEVRQLRGSSRLGRSLGILRWPTAVGADRLVEELIA